MTCSPRGLQLAAANGVPVPGHRGRGRQLALTGDQHVWVDAAGEPSGELHELFHALPVPPLTGGQLRQARAGLRAFDMTELALALTAILVTLRLRGRQARSE